MLLLIIGGSSKGRLLLYIDYWFAVRYELLVIDVDAAGVRALCNVPLEW